MISKKTDQPPNAALPAKCCGHCVHARIATDPGTLQRFVTCKALPPTPVLVHGPKGPAWTARFAGPLGLNDECDLFEGAPNGGKLAS